MQNKPVRPTSMRLLLLLLTVLLLMGGISSCREKPLPPKEPGSTESPGSSGEKDTEAPAKADYPASGDYAQKPFRIMQRKEYSFEFDAENLTGDMVNNAVYSRNLLVEQTYNCVITTQNFAWTWQNKEMLEQLNNLYSVAPEDAFDLISGYQSYIMPTILNGWYTDWNTVPYMKTDAEFWQNGINDSATINGRTYTITGDLAISFWKMMSTMVFNKTWVSNLTTESLYDVVQDGRWTFEYLKTICRAASSNDRTSPDKAGANNVYGFASDWDVALDGFKEAFDCHTVTRNADGGLAINITSEKMDAVVTALQNFYDANASDLCYCYRGVDPTNWFRESKAMIVPMRFEMIERLSDVADYGILPYPKWDADQKDYAVSIVDGVSMFLMPRTEKDPEFVGIITMALADQSRKLVIPEYYEKVIRGKAAKDPQSYVMLDLIRRCATMDFGQLWSNSLGGVGHMVRGAVESVVHGVTYAPVSIGTKWEEQKETVEAKLRELLLFFETQPE